MRRASFLAAAVLVAAVALPGAAETFPSGASSVRQWTSRTPLTELRALPRAAGAASLAFNGDTYLAVWAAPHGVVGVRLNRDGTGGPNALRWTPELPITEPELRPHARTDARPSVAFSGDVYLAVWGAANGVVGVRLDAEGKLLDRVPFSIAETAHWSASPKVVWTGDRFVVAWRPGYSTVKAIFLDEDRTMSESFEVFDRDPNLRIVMATDGRNAFVLGEESPQRFAIIHPDGSVRHGSLPSNLSYASVASNGDGYVVAAGAVRQTQLYHVGADTSVTLAETTAYSSSFIFPHDDHYVLLRSESGLHGNVVTGAGKITGERIEISPASSSGLCDAAASTSGDYTFLLWCGAGSSSSPGSLMLTKIRNNEVLSTDSLGYVGTRLAAAGGLAMWLQPDAIRHLRVEGGEVEVTSFAAPDQGEVATAATDTGWFSVWTEAGEGNSFTAIKATSISPQLTRGAAIEIAAAVHPNAKLSVAAGAESLLAAWTNEQKKIFFQRFSPAGEPLDPEPVGVEVGLYPISIVVGWTGQYYVVAFTAYEETPAVHLLRIDTHGAVIDREPRVIARTLRSGAYLYSVAFARNGATSLLTWQEGEPYSSCQITCPPRPPSPFVTAIRMSEWGDPIDERQTILSLDGTMPAAAALDDRFLVVWRGENSISSRVFRSDDLTSGTNRVVATTTVNDLSKVSATATTRDFVVAWDDGYKVKAARIDLVGKAHETFVVADDLPPYGAKPRATVAARDEDLLFTYTRFRHEDGGALRAYMRALYEPAPRQRSVRR